jgi:hypothetical protein
MQKIEVKKSLKEDDKKSQPPIQENLLQKWCFDIQ